MHHTVCMHSPPRACTAACFNQGRSADQGLRTRLLTSVVLVPRQDGVWERGVLQSGAPWQYCCSATVQRRVAVLTRRQRNWALLTPGPIGPCGPGFGYATGDGDRLSSLQGYIAWPLFLAKECHVRGTLATGLMFLKNFLTCEAERCDTWRLGELWHPANTKTETVKISSNANAAFSWNFAPVKISCYAVYKIGWVNIVVYVSV